MAFVRNKGTTGKPRYELAESRREGAEVRQKVLVYLGEYPTLEKAIEGWEGKLARWHQEADCDRRKAEALRDRLREFESRIGTEDYWPPPPSLVSRYRVAQRKAETAARRVQKAEVKLGELRRVLADLSTG